MNNTTFVNVYDRVTNKIIADLEQGVSSSHIYNLVNSGTIRTLRIGKAIRIPVNFVTEYEEAACQQTMISTDYGNTTTEFGTSFGLVKAQALQEGRDAYQRGQQTAVQQNNTVRNI
jgi:excisionase family DNA binding protein